MEAEEGLWAALEGVLKAARVEFPPMSKRETLKWLQEERERVKMEALRKLVSWHKVPAEKSAEFVEECKELCWKVSVRKSVGNLMVKMLECEVENERKEIGTDVSRLEALEKDLEELKKLVTVKYEMIRAGLLKPVIAMEMALAGQEKGIKSIEMAINIAGNERPDSSLAKLLALMSTTKELSMGETVEETTGLHSSMLMCAVMLFLSLDIGVTDGGEADVPVFQKSYEIMEKFIEHAGLDEAVGEAVLGLWLLEREPPDESDAFTTKAINLLSRTSLEALWRGHLIISAEKQVPDGFHVLKLLWNKYSSGLALKFFEQSVDILWPSENPENVIVLEVLLDEIDWRNTEKALERWQRLVFLQREDIRKGSERLSSVILQRVWEKVGNLDTASQLLSEIFLKTPFTKDEKEQVNRFLASQKGDEEARDLQLASAVLDIDIERAKKLQSTEMETDEEHSREKIVKALEVAFWPMDLPEENIERIPNLFRRLQKLTLSERKTRPKVVVSPSKTEETVSFFDSMNSELPSSKKLKDKRVMSENQAVVVRSIRPRTRQPLPKPRPIQRVDEQNRIVSIASARPPLKRPPSEPLEPNDIKRSAPVRTYPPSPVVNQPIQTENRPRLKELKIRKNH